MTRLLALSLICLVTPAVAEVTHNVDGRFGVSYVNDASGSSAVPLYEGRYTTTISHQADNGLRFRFELSIVAGNIEERGQRPWPVGTGIGSDED